MPLILQGSKCRLTSWVLKHADALQFLANDPSVVKYLSLAVPYPYTLEDAIAWIEQQRDADPQLHFAIESEGQLVGSIASPWVRRNEKARRSSDTS